MTLACDEMEVRRLMDVIAARDAEVARLRAALEELRGLAAVASTSYVTSRYIETVTGAALASPPACDECNDTGINGERPDDGAPLVYTACQGPDGPKRRGRP